MKSKKNVNRVVLFMLGIILVTGITACSFEQKEGTAASEPTVESKTTEAENMVTETPEKETMKSETEAEKTETPESIAAEDDGKEYSGAEEIIEGDPIVGIVDKFADDLIVIRDAHDEDLIYYFSTQNADVIEGDSSIAAGDIVAITYKGVMGDEEHPGVAVKVVAESMMYK